MVAVTEARYNASNFFFPSHHERKSRDDELTQRLTAHCESTIRCNVPLAENAAFRAGKGNGGWLLSKTTYELHRV